MSTENSKKTRRYSTSKRGSDKDFATRFNTKAAYINNAIKIIPNPDEILRKSGKQIEVYRSLLYDSHIYSCVQSRKSGTLRKEFRILQNKATESVYDMVKRQVDMLDMETIIGEILETALFGFNVSEISWSLNGSGWIYAYDISSRPQEWFRFDAENNPVFLSKDNQNGEQFPARKMLLTQHGSSYLNPYGTAVLSRCFWPVTFKKEILAFALKYAEKYGGTFIVGEYDPDVTDKKIVDDLLDDLDALTADGVGVVPKGTKVLLEDAAKGSSIDLYGRMIVMFNAEISKAILSQTLTTEQGDTGSYAMSQTHLTVRDDVIESDCKLVQKTINKFIRWFIDLNFPFVADYPTFEFYEEADVKTSFAERDVKLYSQGVRFKKEYYVRQYGFGNSEIDIVDTQATQSGTTGTPVEATKTGETVLRPSGVFATQYAQSIALSRNIVDTSSMSSEQESELMTEIFRPVIDMINSGRSFDDVNSKLAEIFPELNTKELEKYFATSLFYADMLGRLSTPAG